MQTSHVISDLFLTATCVWVLYECIRQPRRPLLLVWQFFFGAVGLAALFGALRFANVHPSMIQMSQFFQMIASTLGSCGLVAGVIWLFKRVPTAGMAGWTTLIGVACLVAGYLIEIPGYYSILQMVAMVAVLVIAVWYWLKPRSTDHRKIAWRLILAIIFSAGATASLRVLSEPNSIDVFHYLLGAGMLCFGWAAMHANTSVQPQVS
jgi:hypothetical protein